MFRVVTRPADFDDRRDEFVDRVGVQPESYQRSTVVLGVELVG